MRAVAQRSRQSGFTLPELVVVGSCLLLLAFVALALLRPVDLEKARHNAKRRTDVARILQAVLAYKTEHSVLPPHITAEERMIASEELDNGLCVDLVPAYLPDLPTDPLIGFKVEEQLTCEKDEQVHATGYTIWADERGVVSVAAPAAEDGETIILSR